MQRPKLQKVEPRRNASKSSKSKLDRQDLMVGAALIAIVGAALSFGVLILYLAVPWAVHVFMVASDFWFGP